MTSSIFTKLLLEWDKELKNEKVVLLLDNCSAHPADEDLCLKHIKLVFLPPNTTAIIQPLDQGIIRSFKFHYRKMVVRKIICDINCDSSLELLTAKKLSKSLTILESMHLTPIDDNLQTSGEKSDSDIVTDIKNCKVISNQEMEESDSEDEIKSSVPSSLEVKKAPNVLRRALEQRGGNIENYKNFYKLSNDVE
ncbi:jerky protein homolog-like [Parasteatoda tepidariorum]|uniref:jerky protein homolog-like n=1 Tax=Parasteatoda tepidariorum TaxID=114398 RepID=UPI0039BCE727